MAKMIPPVIAANAPQGEQMLFRKLRDDPATKAWVVFHSFDIRRHVTRGQGEADLIVAVPALGILCIEVKGCGVTRQDGLWTYHYDSPRTTSVGPFRQASDASHSLRAYIASRDPAFQPVIFYSAVFFTEIDFKERSLEWEPWQAIGKTELLRNPVSTLVIKTLEAAHSRIRGMLPVPSWYGARSRPSEKSLESLIRHLRPNFEYTVTGSSKVQSAEQTIKRFTEEQFVALDAIEENPRLMFKGPAGTGKTLLAIETARRAVRERRSAALVCYNKLLAAWLREETSGIAKEAREAGVSFFVGTLSSLMLSIARTTVPSDATSSYWSNDLPSLAVETLLSLDSIEETYELLILDEAQDLLTDSQMDVLELVVVGGWAAGNWVLFGDFERQAIYSNANAQPGLNKLKRRTNSAYATYPLRINCRNSKAIADLVTLASQLVPGYSRVLANLDAADVEPVFYRTAEQQVDKLLTAIRTLRLRFSTDQIVVLSMRSPSTSCAALAKDKLEGIRFESVHAFKGLEAPAVILTDIESIEDDQAKALVYVGMTRARLSLVLLMADALRKPYDALLLDGYKAIRSGVT